MAPAVSAHLETFQSTIVQPSFIADALALQWQARLVQLPSSECALPDIAQLGPIHSSPRRPLARAIHLRSCESIAVDQIVSISHFED